jgi:DNA-binding transcriptional regulator YiaG
MTPTQRLAATALGASGLSITQLARALAVSPEALRTWTTGTRNATGPARILLNLWADDPELAANVCGRAHD